MINKDKLSSAFRKGLKDFFTKSIVLKIFSLLFAMLLWGYVLMSEDPVRTKTITDVSVNIEGEADLIARKLVLSGNKALDNVAVKVRIALTGYADLTADDITATISLAGCNEKGEYELTVNAASANGTIYSITPAKMSVSVDDLVTRRIPIEVTTTGEMPDGYWADTLSVSRNEIDIEGAYDSLMDISKAVANVDLSACTDSINTSMLLSLVNSEGETVDSSVLIGTLPSVTVRMDVLPMKTVPIDVESALLGTDSLPDNYEMVSNGINGSRSVRIVGDADVLEEINSLSIEPVDISGRKESLLEDVPIIVPEGVTLLDGDTVSLYVNIREKSSSVTYVELPISIEGLTRGLKATLNIQNVDAVLTGRISLINALERRDVEIYIDLSGMTAGRYDVPLTVRIADEDANMTLTSTLSTESVTVTIEE